MPAGFGSSGGGDGYGGGGLYDRPGTAPAPQTFGMGGVPPPPQLPPGAGPGGIPEPQAPASNAAPLPLINEMDLSIQCNPAFLRASVTKLVVSQAAATACKVSEWCDGVCHAYLCGVCGDLLTCDDLLQLW